MPPAPPRPVLAISRSRHSPLLTDVGCLNASRCHHPPTLRRSTAARCSRYRSARSLHAPRDRLPPRPRPACGSPGVAAAACCLSSAVCGSSVARRRSCLRTRALHRAELLCARIVCRAGCQRLGDRITPMNSAWRGPAARATSRLAARRMELCSVALRRRTGFRARALRSPRHAYYCRRRPPIWLRSLEWMGGCGALRRLAPRGAPGQGLLLIFWPRVHLWNAACGVWKCPYATRCHKMLPTLSPGPGGTFRDGLWAGGVGFGGFTIDPASALRVRLRSRDPA